MEESIDQLQFVMSNKNLDCVSLRAFICNALNNSIYTENNNFEECVSLANDDKPVIHRRFSILSILYLVSTSV